MVDRGRRRRRRRVPRRRRAGRRLSGIITTLKRAVRATCGETTQRRLRRAYVTARVLAGLGRRERELDVLSTLVGTGDHAVDVGANVGIYTKALSKLVGARGRVHSFEPVADNYEILCSVVRFGRLANVEVSRLALGARPASGEIVVPDRAGFGGYYTAHLAHDGEPGRREAVDVQTLDALAEAGTLGRVDVVKCDVEGAELDVLTGGTVLFTAQRPVCLVEVSPSTAGGVFAFFDGLGYRRLVFDGTLSPAEGRKPAQVAKFVFVHPSRNLGSGR